MERLMKPGRRYFIINIDEPYAEKVVDEFVKKSEHNRVTGEIMTKLDKIFDILMSIKTGNKQL